MDWKEVGKKIAKIGAPLLGGVLGGPAGAGIGTLVASLFGADPDDPADVLQKMAADPEAAVKLRELELRHAERLEEMALRHAEIDAEERITAIREVNATMRTESQSEHWPQYSWRPANGFSFPAAVILVYFLLPYLDKNVPTVPELVWVGWLAILGVATWDRGKEKRAVAGEEKTGILEGVINAIRGGKP